jgi:hypothetical protein
MWGKRFELSVWQDSASIGEAEWRDDPSFEAELFKRLEEFG